MRISNLILLLPLFCGCNSAPPQGHLHLIGDIWSNLSLNELRDFTCIGRYTIAKSYEKRIDSSARGPFFHEEWFRIEGFCDMGEYGALEMEFINDRLKSTIFYPKSINAYTDTFARVTGLYLPEGETSERSGPLIKRAMDPGKGGYIIWRDMRLAYYMEGLAAHYDD